MNFSLYKSWLIASGHQIPRAERFTPIFIRVNSTAQGFSVEDTKTDDLYFNFSEIKLSITSLFSVQIMTHFGASDIIYSDVIYSFISEILKHESLVIVSSTETWAALFTPI